MEIEGRLHILKKHKKMNWKMKHGLLSSMVVVFVIAISVLFNLVIERLKCNFDMTSDEVYTISDQSKSIVAGLDKDTTIYVLSAEDNYTKGYKQILNEYKKASKNIHVEYKDMTLYPSFAYDYIDATTTINDGSIIVVCGDKNSYIDSADFTSTTYDSSYNAVTQLEFEPLLTAAINTVNDPTTSAIYSLTGHNELSLDASILNQLTRDNYSYSELSLVGLKAVPEDAAVILINSPTSDLSEDDYVKLKNYMNKGGNIAITLEATIDELVNLDKLIADCGVVVNQGVIFEQSNGMYYQDTPTYLLPTVCDATITEPLISSKMLTFIPVAKGLTISSKSDYTITGLLKTSDYAYSKTNLNSDTIEREDNDIMGPFYVAAIAEKDGAGSMFIISSANALSPEINQAVSGANANIFLNGINYMNGDSNKVSVRSKTIENYQTIYDSKVSGIIAVSTIILLPVFIIFIGLIVVIKRRNK